MTKEEMALVCLRELVPYMEEKTAVKMAAEGKSTTFTAFCRGHESRDEEVFKLKYVPGHLECKKCNFHLVSQTLYMKSGTIGANNKSDDCPNGCGPLWKIAWRDHAEAAIKSSNKLGIENVRLRKEVELLRMFGDKHCTAMADEAIEVERREWAEIDKLILEGI